MVQPLCEHQVPGQQGLEPPEGCHTAYSETALCPANIVSRSCPVFQKESAPGPGMLLFLISPLKKFVFLDRFAKVAIVPLRVSCAIPK